MKIAVVGSGISGLTAAWSLRNTADVTVFEKQARIGGHSYTVDIEDQGKTLPVDVGFIVCNPLNYKNLLQFFDHLGVATHDSDMSFAVSDPNGFEWSSNRGGFFAWKRNLLNPAYLGFLREIVRFCKTARDDLAAGDVPDANIDQYLDRKGFSDLFRDQYLLPMGGAIWSTSEKAMREYPAQSLLRFFDNHRLLHLDRPIWRTVQGGSRTYVEKIAADLGDRIRRSAGVVSVSPAPGGGVWIRAEGCEAERFDEVILAGHSDETLTVLDPAFEEARFLLTSVRYAPNTAYLHRDTRLMPRRKAAWAAWNVMRSAGAGEDVCVSYWMNTLQALPTTTPVLVTLNPAERPDPALTWGEYAFSHPQFDAAGEAARRSIQRIQGQDSLWFAGAWLGYGFHEDGHKSGLAAGLALGGAVPWTPVDVPVYAAPDRIAPAPARPALASAT